MWRVGDIKIELAIGHQDFYCGQPQKLVKKMIYFTLQAFTRKQKEILWWAIKGEKPGIHRGTNAFSAKIGCGATSVEGDKMRSVRKTMRNITKKHISHEFRSVGKLNFENCGRYISLWHRNFFTFFLNKGQLRQPVTQPKTPSTHLWYTYSEPPWHEDSP